MNHPANYLLCFFLPLSSTLFFSSGLHSLGNALIWLLPCLFILLADWLSPSLTQTPTSTLPKVFYDALLIALASLHLGNLVLMCSYVSQLTWTNSDDILTGMVNIIVIRFLIGTCAGICTIVVAHELLHRPPGFMHALGRLLLCSMCYDHFVVAHQQGHHQGVKLQDDFTTARLGETFRDYWRRIYWRHLPYAWSLEQHRLGTGMSLRNQVLQGLLLELVLIVAIFMLYGWVSTGLFLYQSFIAVRILETINYVQHWGLSDVRYRNSFGWVNDSWFTHYLLLGLANHIGHHQNEQTPYYRIPYSDRGPKMPYGYLIMNLWAKLHNASYQAMARQELERYRSN